MLIVAALSLLAGCTTKTSKQPQNPRPSFSADSAYQYIEDQMAFGPRVPNSQGHTDCVVYLVQQLRRFGADVTLQKGTMTDYAGRQQPVVNIIGHIRPESVSEAMPAILLAAHYDTRPWCDQEEEYSDRFVNVPGANDGASGVGILLEVARQLSEHPASMPVEIAFFDLEDSGMPDFYTGEQREHTWCLGSQLWAANIVDNKIPTSNYSFGLLLDMVGAPDASFPREYYSSQYASNYQEKIWKHARDLGHGRYFSDQYSYPIIDDHYYVNIAGIPCVDIIHYDLRQSTGFPEWWHTRRDDLRNIDKNTLQAVGEVVMSLLVD